MARTKMRLMGKGENHSISIRGFYTASMMMERLTEVNIHDDDVLGIFP